MQVAARAFPQNFPEVFSTIGLFSRTIDRVAKDAQTLNIGMVVILPSTVLVFACCWLGGMGGNLTGVVRKRGIFLKGLSELDRSFFESRAQDRTRAIAFSAATFDNILPREAVRRGEWTADGRNAFDGLLHTFQLTRSFGWTLEQTANESLLSEIPAALDWFAVKYEIEDNGRTLFLWRVISQARDAVLWRVSKLAIQHQLQNNYVNLSDAHPLYDAIDKLLFKNLGKIITSEGKQSQGSNFETDFTISDKSVAGPDVGHREKVIIPESIQLPVARPQVSQEIISTNWWRFPFSVGQNISLLKSREHSLHCAIVLPVIDYAAAFMTAGLLIGNASLRLTKESGIDPKQYFDWIGSLSEGTKVIVCYTHTLLVGRIRGRWYDRIAKANAIWVEYVVDGRIVVDPYHVNTAWKIVPVSPPIFEALNLDPDYLDRLASLCFLLDFDLRTLAEMIAEPNDRMFVYGEKNQFLEEAAASVTSLIRPEAEGGSSLNEIVQVSDLRTTVLPRTDAISTVSLVEKSKNADRSFIVFRGSRAFLRHAHDFSDSSWIAILGANESRLTEAADVFNSMFTQRSADIETIAWPIPMRGSEFMAFRK